jgi:hypothetical protein
VLLCVCVFVTRKIFCPSIESNEFSGHFQSTKLLAASAAIGFTSRLDCRRHSLTPYRHVSHLIDPISNQLLHTHSSYTVHRVEGERIELCSGGPAPGVTYWAVCVCLNGRPPHHCTHTRKIEPKNFRLFLFFCYRNEGET